MLVSTRHLMGDAAYTTAINMIPIDFNSCNDIMAAWRDYIDAIQPGHDDTLEARMKIASFKQTKLVHLILKRLGYQLSEVDIQATPYAAGGFVERDTLFIRGWESWPRIAQALETQNAHLLGEAKSE